VARPPGAVRCILVWLARPRAIGDGGTLVLDGLVMAAEVARAGVRVEVRIEGTPCELPAGLDLSAYRIVQEALTNYGLGLALLGGRLVVRRDLT
jgi:signal transduction histidine kinase